MFACAVFTCIKVKNSNDILANEVDDIVEFEYCVDISASKPNNLSDISANMVNDQ